jgi:hypothetical protein
MKENVLKDAEKLTPPQENSATEFGSKWELFSIKGSQILGQRSDFEKLVGKGNRQMAEDNNKNFPRFMESMFVDYKPKVFLETVLWVFRAYRSHGFDSTYWAANLNIWVDMLKEDLSEQAFKEIYPFYNWLIVNIPIFVKLADSELTDTELTDGDSD